MTAVTKDQIYQAALDALAEFPTVAAYVQAGDPRILQQIAAQASMLALISTQVDVAQAEPFLKATDATVLADATLKGILPLARACRVAINIENANTSAYTLAAGRRVRDSSGRLWEAEAGVTIPAATTVPVTFVQRTTRVVTHTVATAYPFYRIEVTQTDEDVYLNSLAVRRNGVDVPYAPDWFNVLPGQAAYQLETDEQRRLMVCLGRSDVVGVSAANGDVYELQVTECEGRITDLSAGATFNLEYAYTAEDWKIKATLAEVVDAGADPSSVADLRVMARYPAIYDHDAVFLGNFDFLLRRYLSPIRFLSVWNEQIEEAARGANVANINKLFVAGLVDGMDNAVFEDRVRTLVKRADDSLKVVFVPTAVLPVAVAVTARVGVVHDAATVTAQIRDAVLGQYGAGQKGVSRGQTVPIRFQAIYELLRKQVPAFQDGQADFQVTVTLPATILPEQFLHVTTGSLTVTVTRSDFNNGQWNY